MILLSACLSALAFFSLAEAALNSTTAASTHTITATIAPSAAAPAPSDCTFTKVTAPTFLFGPVRTKWNATQTITSHIDCSGCRHVAVTSLNAGPGPVQHFNATTTLAATNTTSFMCLKTPSVITSSPTLSTVAIERR